MSRPAIVIDNGSSSTKLGFAGCEEPRCIFPTVIGTPNTDQQMVGGQNKDFFVGVEALAKRDLLDVRYPVSDGVVNSWEDIERIWRYCFYDELHIVPDDYSVLVTEKPLIRRTDREKVVQIMFETFKVKYFYLAMQAILALFSLGKTTGVVWDAGDGLFHTVPIYEGYGLPHAVQRSGLSGAMLTSQVRNALISAGAPEDSCDSAATLAAKEHVCEVALDYQATTQEAAPVTVTLPDGERVEIGVERFRIPEALFNPSLVGEQGASVHQDIFNAIDNCEQDVRRDMYGSIVLAGGTSMFKGLPERVEKEIIALDQPSMKVKVVATPGRRNSVWLGGSILASLEAFPQMCIAQEEYKEEGVQIVHRKCYC